MVRIDLVSVRLPIWPSAELAPRLAFERGGIIALLGSPDGGRVACLDVLTGLIRPPVGRVFFDDCDVTADGPVRRNVARVFPQPAVYPTLSVRANLAMSRPTRGTRVEEVADVLGLRPDLETRAGALTDARAQRVALGRAFVRDDAAAILLDDPLALVPVHERADLRAAIEVLAADVRATVVWGTSDIDEALTVAARVVVIEGGWVVHDAPAGELLRAPSSTVLAAALGELPMNLLPCDVRSGVLRVGTAQLPLASAVVSKVKAMRLQLGVRPQDLRLVPAARPNALVAQLHAFEHRGTCKIATLRADNLSLTVLCDVEQQLVPGYRYYVEIPPECARLYADGVLEHA